MKITIKKTHFQDRHDVKAVYGVFIEGKLRKEFLTEKEAKDYIKKLKGGK